MGRRSSMKCKNKSKLFLELQCSVVEMVCVIFVLATVTKSGLAQRFNPHRQHRAQNVWGDPYRQYSYQFIPSLPYSSGGAGFIGGGSIVEAVKSHPLHYSSMIGGGPPHPAAAPPPFLSTAASNPSSSYYSGYYYGGDKRGKGRPYSSVSSSMHYPQRYQTMNPATVTTITSSSPPSYGRPSSPPSYHIPSRFPPGPLASPSMDTYREALDLFSEVVHKLERETGPGFGAFSSPSYLHSSLSNGIYGSSPTSDYRHQHLDSIMGPDFLQRAHKLYNKIIKEQNDNRGPPPPEYYPSSASRGHPMSGLSYLESAMQPGSSSSTRTTSYSYSHPSPYARNDIVSDNGDASETPMQKSLIDTVRSMEVNVQKDNGEPDLMETSESRMVPQFSSQPNQYFRNHIIEGISSSVAPPQPSPSPEQPRTTMMSPSLPPPSPLNENDFIEHPLPFNEYEELIKEIAASY